MKRYLAFKFDCYYPSGGLNDVSESFDSLEEAIAHCREGYSDFRYVWDRIEDKTWELD